MTTSKSFPSKINIMGHQFKVEYKKLEKNTFGETVVEERVIRINIDKHKNTWRATLLHECLHAVFGLSGQTELLEEAAEEGLVVALENGLLNLVDFRRF